MVEFHRQEWNRQTWNKRGGYKINGNRQKQQIVLKIKIKNTITEIDISIGVEDQVFKRK